MCDYSLEHQNSRDAKLEDVIITLQFKNSSTMGFTAVGKAEVAVCLKPGTELMFDKTIEVDGFFTWAKLLSRGSYSKVAVFRKVNLNLIPTHHDALELPDGQIVLINSLCKGQRARIVQLPANPLSRWTGDWAKHEHELAPSELALLD